MILGTTFFWLDQLAYTIGIALVAPLDWLLIFPSRSNLQSTDKPPIAI